MTRHSRARELARELLEECGFTEPRHIRVTQVARLLGVTIEHCRLDGARAQLVRVGQTARIQLSSRVRDEGERRFNTAHELGHYVLDHVSPLRWACEHEDEADAAKEAEANAFASELLMPTKQADAYCRGTPVDLTGPREIARRFRVTLLAAAIRYTELSPHACAAVFSRARKIDWYACSDAFRPLTRVRALRSTSLAHGYFQHNWSADRRALVPLNAWVDDDLASDIVEHATYSVEHNSVLSMLWVREDLPASKRDSFAS